MRLGYQSTIGSGQLYFGRADKFRNQRFRIEWSLGRKSQNFSAKAWIFAGDADNDLTFILGAPWLFHVYFTICGLFKPCEHKERQFGIATHNGAFWLYLFPYTHESSSNDPWYRKTYCWNFPWTFDWHQTEVLTHLPMGVGTPVYVEQKGNRSIKDWEKREAASKTVTEEYPYRYVLKSGEVQERIASVWVERMEWRARWYPFIWRRKVRTSIDVRFNGEVGEKAGSWKGGCTGCGYEMRPQETPEECLRRMEREREFK